MLSERSRSQGFVVLADLLGIAVGCDKDAFDSASVTPLAFEAAAVCPTELTVAVFLATLVLTNVLAAILPLVNSLAMHLTKNWRTSENSHWPL